MKRGDLPTGELSHTVREDGTKPDLRKVTITLPQEIFELVVNECARRKVAGQRNHLISSLIREAVSSYFAEGVSTTG